MADTEGQMATQRAHRRITAPLDAIEAIRQGFPAGRLDEMARLLSVERSLFLGLLGLSERTLQRKAQSTARLSPVISDRLARLDRIIQLASEVFGIGDKGIEWLKRPSRALGGEIPLKLLDTDTGTQRVERELRQIQHGFVF